MTLYSQRANQRIIAESDRLMPCPLAGVGVRMYRSTYVRMCLIIQGRGKDKQCGLCKRGSLIKAGKPFKKPKGYSWFKEPERKVKMDTRPLVAVDRLSYKAYRKGTKTCIIRPNRSTNWNTDTIKAGEVAVVTFGNRRMLKPIKHTVLTPFLEFTNASGQPPLKDAQIRAAKGQYGKNIKEWLIAYV